MSEIINNPDVEETMSKKFLSKVYLISNKISDDSIGINPFNIWKELGYNAFHENVIPIILDRLIQNNVKEGFLRFDKQRYQVFLTVKGKNWADNNYFRYT